MFQIVGNDILFGGEKVGLLTVPLGTLRDAVAEALHDEGYDAGFEAGHEEGFEEGCNTGRGV